MSIFKKWQSEISNPNYQFSAVEEIFIRQIEGGSFQGKLSRLDELTKVFTSESYWLLFSYMLIEQATHKHTNLVLEPRFPFTGWPRLWIVRPCVVETQNGSVAPFCLTCGADRHSDSDLLIGVEESGDTFLLRYKLLTYDSHEGRVGGKKVIGGKKVTNMLLNKTWLKVIEKRINAHSDMCWRCYER